MLQEVASQYNSRTEFERGNIRAYSTARYKKILDEICNHMTYKYIYWTDEMLQNEALKYNNRSDFKHGNETAYQQARRKKIINKICSHMNYQLISWTNESLLNLALQYDTIKDFAKNNASAYQQARVRGILKVCCSHMKRNVMGGFNPKLSGYLYYIRFDSELNQPIYKIGITNNEDVSVRIKSMGVSKEYTTTVICKYYYDDGYECIEAEKLYHKEFERFRYLGEDILHDGNTELFIKDVLNLDK